MGKIGLYQKEDKYKKYNLPTSKPQRSHPYYEEKLWTLQEQIFKKLNIISKLLLNLYPKLTDQSSINIKDVIESNLKTLIDDLEFLQSGLDKDPSSFNTSKLKTNQKRIDEMKHVCDTLQTVRTYENEYKNLGKIKHALHELQHLIQPSPFQQSLNKAAAKIKKSEKATTKKKPASKAKKTKAKAAVNPKTKKRVAPKAKPVKKAKLTAKKVVRKKAKPVKKAKLTAKKVVKKKAKSTAKSKL